VHFFVYEYASACGDAALPASLRSEGGAMLRAIAEDLVCISGAEVRTLLGSAVENPLGCRMESVRAEGEERAFRRLARWADFSLVVAPEFHGLLETRCRWVEEENGRLLGPCSKAIALTGDKLALADHIEKRGVRMPHCVPLGVDGSPVTYPLVCKPRHGAGSLATFRVRDPAELSRCLALARDEGWYGEMLLQAYVPGTAASVAFLVGPRQTLELPPASQHLSDDGRFRYRGGSLPLPGHLADRAVRVARPAIEAVPGLAGYVGIDVLLGERSDGRHDWVIEINPRLTTSYLGLRRLAKTNLAEAIVSIFRGHETPPMTWHEGLVRFAVDPC